MSAPWFRQPVYRHRLIRVALVLFFAWLAGRFWHPYYGFTRFLMMDTASAAATLPELRAAPIFLYPDGYDGHYYAQLAARPAVDDPALNASIDALPYRARRILLSWTAWAAGLGDPVRAVQAYAWLNLVLWGALAALLWRLLPCRGWRETVAWAGLLFSAGVLHSVRLALTDLLALLMVAGATWCAAAQRRGSAAALLGLGALARETVLLGAVTLLPAERADKTGWVKAAGWGALAMAPLAAWMWYLGSRLGWSEPGVGNFTLPVAGFLGKWMEVVRRIKTEPDHYLALTTLLAHLGLTLQVVYVLGRAHWRDHWWRLGAVFAGLMLLLGTAVWEGHPGAALRVLLPLSLAFNLLAVRHRAAPLIMVLGNFSVLSGVLVFWAVPPGLNELAAGRMSGGSYVVHTDTRWYAMENWKGHAWSWSASGGGLSIDLAPRTNGNRTVQLAVKGMNRRTLEIRQAGRVLWRGEIAETQQWIELPGVAVANGRIDLELSCDAPPVSEGPGGRTLGVAVYGARVD